MNKRRNRAWFGCAGLIALSLFAYICGPAIVIYARTKRALEEDASLARLPKPIPTSSTAQATGKELAYFGVEFNVPWSGEPQVKQTQRFARVQFPEGQFVLLFDPSVRIDRIRVLAESGRGREVERILGKDATQSNYSLVEVILNIGPNDISLWKPRIELVRNCVFLMLKKAELANTETGLFHFHNQRTKGFQKGDPARSPVVDLDLFDDADREYEMIVGSTTGTNGRVSQEDINLILSTIKAMRGRSQPDTESPSAG